MFFSSSFYTALSTTFFTSDWLLSPITIIETIVSSEKAINLITMTIINYRNVYRPSRKSNQRLSCALVATMFSKLFCRKTIKMIAFSNQLPISQSSLSCIWQSCTCIHSYEYLTACKVKWTLGKAPQRSNLVLVLITVCEKMSHDRSVENVSGEKNRQ